MADLSASDGCRINPVRLASHHMPEFMPKLPLVHVLPALPSIFFAAVAILLAVLSFARALARFGPQRFAKSAFLAPTF